MFVSTRKIVFDKKKHFFTLFNLNPGTPLIMKAEREIFMFGKKFKSTLFL